jgi:hypothetical protein
MTRKPDETRHADDADSGTAGGLTVTLWLLAILLAQVEVVLWLCGRFYAARGSATPHGGSRMAAAAATLSSFTN